MLDEVFNELRASLDKAIEALRRDMGKVRTGRANLTILDGVRVQYYGVATPLNQVANMTVADPRLIVIAPWEKSIIADIEKGIQQAELGLQPSNDGKVIRLPIPALTEERRRDLVKTVKKLGEESKVAIRNGRRDANEMVKELEKEKEISEDDRDKALARVQASTDDYIQRVDEMVVNKEKELMEV